LEAKVQLEKLQAMAGSFVTYPAEAPPRRLLSEEIAEATPPSDQRRILVDQERVSELEIRGKRSGVASVVKRLRLTRPLEAVCWCTWATAID
jgi:hypothetical protein